ncbi:aspartyl protease family protein [Flavobacterium sinopsychrotolerans]|uniref:Aspartyl protease n=1 Tax=Flavobacterium sinopsychrotolerans TaxID=604089 RepID=A0A1H8RK10_9FLAO|nr:aspartyl protease family protein [Flavobacterium sinopsychrotolerans]SEO66518.1 Aspartyl protease [Flavobacterium sinopsychrotolerans]
MKIKYLFLILIVNQSVFAQNKIQTLKSNTKSISIKEGESFYKDVWDVSPEINPDIFITNRFKKSKKITFYSDIDSISFEVKPQKKYNFVILINNTEKAFTQINTFQNETPSLSPKLVYQRKKLTDKIENDTIPFLLGQDNRIHIKGKINSSEYLDFLFDTGAGANVITSSLINTKVKLEIDGSSENSGSDGKSIVQTSSNNIMEIGNLVWQNVSLVSIDYKNFPFDAVLSWKSFGNKSIEIDYNKNRLIIHNTPIGNLVGYSKSEMKLIEGIPYIKCKLIINDKEYETWYDFDTGSNATLSISQKFASENSLNNTMKNIGTAKTRGSTGIEFKQNKVLLPKLKIGGFEMYQVPIFVSEKDPENGHEYNENIGNNILKRFDAILDFKNNFIYLKPNQLMYKSTLD